MSKLWVFLGYRSFKHTQCFASGLVSPQQNVVTLFCTCRNLSSVNEKTRQQMRETLGLVDSLVGYIKSCFEDNKSEDKVRYEQIMKELNLCCCLHTFTSFLIT